MPTDDRSPASFDDPDSAQVATRVGEPGRLSRAVRRFLHTEATGGLVLLLAAALALGWANSAWDASYRSFWGTELNFHLGPWTVSDDLRHWVNEGLMALFFFVVGLEIKRELVCGELRDRRAAALPVIAAAGGMVAPALVYLAVAGAGAAGGAALGGWGIPMATDIAFAVGVIAVLGARVPPALKLFLLTLAIVDDIGAIVVIAAFYSSGIDIVLLGLALAFLASFALVRRLGVSSPVAFLVLGLAAWAATRGSGVHATIAGVALGLLTPARPLEARAVARDWARDLGDAPSRHELETMMDLGRKSISPAERLEHLLHPWTSFVVVPLFALANAGVAIGAASLDEPGASTVALAVVAGLVVGKLVGITGASWLAVRCGMARLPDGVTWPMVVGVGALGGIGFTVSLFVGDLAFETEALGDAAKVGVLGASATAAVIGIAVLTRAGRPARDSTATGDEDD